MDPQVVIACASVLAFAVGAYVFWGPSSHKRRKPGCIVGMVNTGNTCFINTLLQALASCPFMVEWFKSQRRVPGSLAEALFKTVRVLNGREPILEDYYTPTSVVRALNANGWVISAGEQDAHELFLIIISTLKEEVQAVICTVSIADALLHPADGHVYRFVRGAVSIGNSSDDIAKTMDKAENAEISIYRTLRHPVKSLPPFQGFLATQLKCITCKYKSSLLYEQFDSLSLTLPYSEGILSKKLTLASLLDNYIAPEIVKGVLCEGCNEDSVDSNPIRRTALKTLSFGKLPKCLCFHIQRTTWQSNGMAMKRYDHVAFPEFLAMDPYTFMQMKKRKSLAEVYQDVQDRTASRQAAASRIKHLYRLVAIVVHTGSLHRGHFITYRRAPLREHCWYFTSDKEVRESSLQEAMSACAYMLFYSKIPPRRSCSTTTLNV